MGDMPTTGAVRDRFLHHAQTIAIPYVQPRYVLGKPEELELLNKYSDAEVAGITGQEIAAVRQKRAKLDHAQAPIPIASPSDFNHFG